MKDLKVLNLPRTGVDDAGLMHLKDLVHSRRSTCRKRSRTPGFPALAGLTNLAPCTTTSYPGIKGPGLQHLKDLSR